MLQCTKALYRLGSDHFTLYRDHRHVSVPATKTTLSAADVFQHQIYRLDLFVFCLSFTVPRSAFRRLCSAASFLIVFVKCPCEVPFYNTITRTAPTQPKNSCKQSSKTTNPFLSRLPNQRLCIVFITSVSKTS